MCYCGCWHLTSRLDIKEVEIENSKLKSKVKNLEMKISEILAKEQKEQSFKIRLDKRVFEQQQLINNLQKKLTEARSSEYTFMGKYFALEKKLSQKLCSKCTNKILD